MKICLFCNNLVFSTGYPGYSDITPGQDAVLFCSKGFWDILGAYDDLYKSFMSAESCKHYELDQWVKERYKLKDE